MAGNKKRGGRKSARRGSAASRGKSTDSISPNKPIPSTTEQKPMVESVSNLCIAMKEFEDALGDQLPPTTADLTSTKFGPFLMEMDSFLISTE